MGSVLPYDVFDLWPMRVKDLTTLLLIYGFGNDARNAKRLYPVGYAFIWVFVAYPRFNNVAILDIPKFGKKIRIEIRAIEHGSRFTVQT
jgi:hypothetical protein